MRVFPLGSVASLRVNEDPWLSNFPGPADNRFNYYHLLELANSNQNSIGNAPDGSARNVIICGAGIAGIAAARELVRSGYKVILNEASDRIAGRHYTTQDDPEQATGMELGAMRFPFFDKPGSGNCLLDYYWTKEIGGKVLPFTNPGQTEGGTGIWVNGGRGTDPNNPTTPKLISWPDKGKPDNPDLAAIYETISGFISNVQNWVGSRYVQDSWHSDWADIVNLYDRMTFGDLVFTEKVDPSDYKSGWFGGLGFSQDQSDLFYTIGAGDGSWGAFYEVGALWFLRCVMFGFQSNLQSLVSIPNRENLPYFRKQVKDSTGQTFQGPEYLGIQALSEALFYLKAPGQSQSLYEMAQFESGSANDDAEFHFQLNTLVREINFSKQTITYEGKSGIKTEMPLGSETSVIVTPNLYASERYLNIVPSDEHVPTTFLRERATKTQHNINSCKVFYKLKETYWSDGNSNIPQNLVTDTAAQDAYGVRWSTDASEKGVLLASYTWEDDATKFVADTDSDATLAEFILDELDKITDESVGEKISDYVDTAYPATVIHWALEPSYRGCAKLYRNRNERLNNTLLAYNHNSGKEPRLFLAGENYSVEGGWTEPALRTAMDAAIRIIKVTGGTFNNGFDYDKDYHPEIPPLLTPNEKYPYSGPSS